MLQIIHSEFIVSCSNRQSMQRFWKPSAMNTMTHIDIMEIRDWNSSYQPFAIFSSRKWFPRFESCYKNERNRLNRKYKLIHGKKKPHHVDTFTYKSYFSVHFHRLYIHRANNHCRRKYYHRLNNKQMHKNNCDVVHEMTERRRWLLPMCFCYSSPFAVLIESIHIESGFLYTSMIINWLRT